jgi:hypothetical protein
MSSEQRKRRGEEQIPFVGSEREGPVTIGSTNKCMKLNPCVCRRVDLSKSQNPKVNWDRPSSRRTSGVRSTTLEVSGKEGGQISEVNPGR